MSALPIQLEVPADDRASDPKTLVAHFLLQVQICHVRTHNRDPSPLHFDPTTKQMVQYLWPVDSVTGQRLVPSDFESYRRTHELRAPCCLCAFIDDKAYTEARIGVAETLTQDLTRSQSVLNGEIVAVCEKQRCGYFLCLERFYPLRGLKSRVCPQRRVPLDPKDVTLPIVDVDDTFRAGEGLFQVMSDAVIRGRRTEAFQVVRPQKTVRPALVRSLAKGISEEQFWATFVQCLFCHAVIFRETYGANHVCDIKEPSRSTGRYSPYTPPAQSTSATRTRVAASRLQRSYAMSTIPTSPTLTIATEINEEERSDFEGSAASGYQTSDEETDAQDSDSESQADTEAPDLSSDPVFPTLPEVLGLRLQ